MNSPFTAAQEAYLKKRMEERTEELANKIEEGLKDVLCRTPEEKQMLAYFRTLDENGRNFIMKALEGQYLLMQSKARISGKKDLHLLKGGKCV